MGERAKTGKCGSTYRRRNSYNWKMREHISSSSRSCPACPAGRSGLVVTRLPAAREDPGSRRAAGKSLCFHENHCDTQLWARAAH